MYENPNRPKKYPSLFNFGNAHELLREWCRQHAEGYDPDFGKMNLDDVADLEEQLPDFDLLAYRDALETYLEKLREAIRKA